MTLDRMTSRQRATILYIIVLLLGAAIVGFGVTLVTVGATALHRAAATVSCGCSPVTAMSRLGAWTALGIGLLLLLTPVVRFVVVLVRTRKFSNRLRTVPLSPRVRQMIAKLGLTHEVRETHLQTDVAACLGLFTPHLVVSRPGLARLSDEELRAVLEHERYHVLRRDPLRFLVADVFLWPVRPLPLIGQLAQQFKTAVELAADEYAIQAVGTADGLGRALLKFVQPTPGIVAGFGGTIEQRIDQILGRKSERSFLTAVLAAVIVVAGLVLAGATASARVSPRTIDGSQAVHGICQAQVHRCIAPPRASINVRSGIQLLSTQ